MKRREFHNDEEFFDYMADVAKGDHFIHYFFIGIGVILGVFATKGILTYFNMHIPDSGQLFLIFTVIGVFSGRKVSKSDWLKRKDEKFIASVKKRLELSRKVLKDRGADYYIKREEKDQKMVVYFAVSIGSFVACMMAMPDILNVYQQLGFSIVIGTTITIAFIKSKYFKQVIDHLTRQTRQDLENGYLYNRSLPS